MSLIQVDKFISSWAEKASDIVEDKIKRTNFLVLPFTLTFDKQLKPSTC